MNIEFRTRQYEFSHGKAPKGRGCWAFSFEGYEVFSTSMTYGEAKRWCKAEVKKVAPSDYIGTVYVDVLP